MSGVRFFEDFAVGATDIYGSRPITEDEIIAFAREFDPQPFHLDPVAAKTTFAGGLIASGWHTNALIQRINCDAFLSASACLGSPGMDEVRWLRPVRPGDVLSVRSTVLDAVPSASKPDRGTVRFAFDLFNQAGTHLSHLDCRVIFRRRAPATGAESITPMARPAALDTSNLPLRIEETGEQLWFEDIEPGMIFPLGTYRFTAEAIHAFAEAFDPQGFHIDPALAASGPFGGITASGWHTASAWMGRLARDRAARAERTRAAGQTPARLGTSPGFTNLRLLRPVRPDDVVAYASRIIGKRTSQSRPGWGITQHLNTGVNQHGETVMEFTGAVFWECRQP